MKKLSDNPSEMWRITLEADDAYSVAIKKQFGPKATRWTQNPSDHNEETRAAYAWKQMTQGHCNYLVGDDGL